MKKHLIIQIAIIVAIISLVIVMVVDLFPLVREVIANVDDESAMVDYIAQHGSRGVPILVGMQALLIIVPIFPSAAAQVLAGLCYGAFWGAIISLGGLVLGNLLVFGGMRQLQDLIAPLLKRHKKHKGIISKEQLEKIKRPELVAFSFFLIPFIPGGIIPYVFAETKIPIHKYMLAAVAGNIPSVFLCTFLGDRLSAGNYTTVIIIAAVIVVVLVVVLLFRKKIMAKLAPAS
ncbi:MAG: VTT domain-containing protein [Oscillospiraceae bacterium]|nr:VTT domain-containing protein [Oscillospiraceae bacterium]